MYKLINNLFIKPHNKTDQLIFHNLDERVESDQKEQYPWQSENNKWMTFKRIGLKIYDTLECLFFLSMQKTIQFKVVKICSTVESLNCLSMPLNRFVSKIVFIEWMIDFSEKVYRWLK